MSAARAPLDPDNATPVPDGEARQDGTVASHLKVPSGTHVSDIESPARQLQSELEYRLRQEGRFPARYVTATVLVLCLSCWLAVYWLVTSI
ncbi:MAG TPA: hypothetical protein PLR76_01785 [Hyphomonas sp.]|nr:hypothetical protein [Hyphomonas sp.]MCB9963204.1 hypothetical protein [Hyphomonas sp.]MCB9971396.1 hypothetical protein [Hyphomonas sp.]HPE47089.1 hypothetical protein [Hyphomonas sp.]